jgi:hypothetical protein
VLLAVCDFDLWFESKFYKYLIGANTTKMGAVSGHIRTFSANQTSSTSAFGRHFAAKSS